jgi:hypothetical protein
MDKEALELQQKLLDKLNEWKASPEFGKSKYDSQKYNRAKGMLQATHPKVLTEALGITSVPDVPRDTMNLIRSMDLRTLENLEIFRGMSDKVVGHHMSAFGAISGALDNQSPERRLELLNRAIDQGYITGMDPGGIGPIRSSIHLPIAHQGDFSGKKPGYKVPTFTNEDNIEDVWSALESSLKQQKGSFLEARADVSTQDLKAASQGIFDTDLITDLDQSMDVRTAATKAAKPIAKDLDAVIQEFSGNSEAIAERARKLLQGLPTSRQTALINAGRMAKGLGKVLPGAAGGLFTVVGAAGDALATQEGVSKVKDDVSPRETTKGALQAASGTLGLASAVAPNPLTIGGSAITGFLGGVMDHFDKKRERRQRDSALQTGVETSTAAEVPAQITQYNRTPNRYERRNR